MTVFEARKLYFTYLALLLMISIAMAIYCWDNLDWERLGGVPVFVGIMGLVGKFVDFGIVMPPRIDLNALKNDPDAERNVIFLFACITCVLLGVMTFTVHWIFHEGPG